MTNLNNFCPEAELQNPKCYQVERFQFRSEEQIFDILLDVFKSELPNAMKEIMDCEGKPMIILEEAIDLVPIDEDVKFSFVLNPLSDRPVYSENLRYRTVDYSFEAILTVGSAQLKCTTWELTRFKNAVESILMGAQFQIDGFNSVNLEPSGFTYFVPDANSGYYRRQGAYRFSVTVTQYQLN